MCAFSWSKHGRSQSPLEKYVMKPLGLSIHTVGVNWKRNGPLLDAKSYSLRILLCAWHHNSSVSGRSLRSARTTSAYQVLTVQFCIFCILAAIWDHHLMLSTALWPLLCQKNETWCVFWAPSLVDGWVGRFFAKKHALNQYQCNCGWLFKVM